MHQTSSFVNYGVTPSHKLYHERKLTEEFFLDMVLVDKPSIGDECDIPLGGPVRYQPWQAI